MKKYLFLTLLMLVAAMATMSAQDEPMEQTSEPVIGLEYSAEPYERIWYEDDNNNYCKDCFEVYYVTITLENIDNSDATIYYRIKYNSQYPEPEWQVYDGYPITVGYQIHISGNMIEAYAQAEGKLPSEICTEEYFIPVDDGYGLTWMATLYYIDEFYCIQWNPESQPGIDESVALTNNCPMIGGVYNVDWEFKPSSYSGDFVVPEELEFNESHTVGCLPIDMIYNAFLESEITSITLPKTIERIFEGSFQGCSRLTSFTIQRNDPPAILSYVDLGIFGNDTYLYDQVTLYVPNESLARYRADREWGRFSHIVPFVGAGPGDVDGDGVINVSDVTNLVDLLLSGEELPAYIDVNGDGNVNVSDVSVLIDQLLSEN